MIPVHYSVDFRQELAGKPSFPSENGRTVEAVIRESRTVARRIVARRTDARRIDARRIVARINFARTLTLTP